MAEKVLVVDDDRAIREVLRTLLEREGYEVVLGSSGEEAIRLAESEKPHLIILDAKMPDLDGVEASWRLRSQEDTRSIPIIVATAFGDVLAGAADAGIDDFAMKPFHPPELLMQVKGLLHVRHIEDGIERAVAYMQQLRNPPPTR
jgi:two-component system response regulator MprA